MEKELNRYAELIDESRDKPREYYMHTRERIYPSIAVYLLLSIAGFDTPLDEEIERSEEDAFVMDHYC